MFDYTLRSLTGDDYPRRDYEREQERLVSEQWDRFGEIDWNARLRALKAAKPVEDEIKFD
jgi:hypothetical protein